MIKEYRSGKCREEHPGGSLVPLSLHNAGDLSSRLGRCRHEKLGACSKASYVVQLMFAPCQASLVRQTFHTHTNIAKFNTDITLLMQFTPYIQPLPIQIKPPWQSYTGCNPLGIGRSCSGL